jgi:hypothetical protein
MFKRYHIRLGAGTAERNAVIAWNVLPEANASV